MGRSPEARSPQLGAVPSRLCTALGSTSPPHPQKAGFSEGPRLGSTVAGRLVTWTL